jgi:hypothetical protein
MSGPEMALELLQNWWWWLLPGAAAAVCCGSFLARQHADWDGGVSGSSGCGCWMLHHLLFWCVAAIKEKTEGCAVSGSCPWWLKGGKAEVVTFGTKQHVRAQARCCGVVCKDLMPGCMYCI